MYKNTSKCLKIIIQLCDNSPEEIISFSWRNRGVTQTAWARGTFLQQYSIAKNICMSLCFWTQDISQGWIKSVRWSERPTDSRAIVRSSLKRSRSTVGREAQDVRGGGGREMRGHKFSSQPCLFGQMGLLKVIYVKAPGMVLVRLPGLMMESCLNY